MEKIFNQCEASLWAMIAMVLLVRALRGRCPLRRVQLLLAAEFFIFGISDVIEAETGCWWDPWWLAALKIGCVAGFIMGFRRYFILTKPPST